MRLGSWFPQSWNIFKREEQTQVLIVKHKKRTDIKLDDRNTRWVKYWFEKHFKSKGWFYFFNK